MNQVETPDLCYGTASVRATWDPELQADPLHKNRDMWQVCTGEKHRYRRNHSGRGLGWAPPTNSDHKGLVIVFGPLFIPGVPLSVGGGLTQLNL